MGRLPQRRIELDGTERNLRPAVPVPAAVDVVVAVEGDTQQAAAQVEACAFVQDEDASDRTRYCVALGAVATCGVEHAVEDVRLAEEGSRRHQHVVEALAEEKNCTPSQVALAWLVQQPGVTSAIIGPRTMSQLEDNLGAVSVEISNEDRRRLDEVAEPELAIVPYYHGSMIDFKPSQHGWM